MWQLRPLLWTLLVRNSIPIEERDANEVTNWFGIRIAPQGIDVYNPAFDATDAILLV